MEEPVEMVIPRPYLGFLRNPFRFIGPHESFLFGLLIILLSGFIGSLTNTHFDGVLDVHSGAIGPLWVYLAPGFINWLVLAVMLYAAGFIVKGRRTDFGATLGYQAFARAPLLVAVLFTLIPAFQRQAAQPTVFTDDTIVFAVVVLVILVMIVVMAVWMYRGFILASGATGRKALAAFGVGLVAAEIVSKLLFYYVVQPSLTLPNLTPPN